MYTTLMIVEKPHNFLLTSIVPQKMTDEEAFKDIRELKSLVDTFGGKVVEYVIQKREVHDKGIYLGRGKTVEVTELIKEKNIDVVVLNAIIKPGQLYDLKKLFRKSNPEVEVWDRVDLILEIFSHNAKTAEAKLQIELAAMRHMGPRIYGMGYILSRQGGSIGTRGIGETNTELMRRHWRDQMKKTKDKLLKLNSEKERQLERRQKMGMKTVSLVGYTNAGKTSLFNRLSGKNNLVQNALFATLDSSVSKLYLPEKREEVLLSDTIGFIKNLPPSLIDAFKSTLLETLHADLLLHVIDVTDEEMEKKIEVVLSILNDLGLSQVKQILVFNKAENLPKKDLESLIEKYSSLPHQLISVKNDRGIKELLQKIENEL